MKDYLLRRKYVMSPSARGEIPCKSVEVKSVVGSHFGRDKPWC